MDTRIDVQTLRVCLNLHVVQPADPTVLTASRLWKPIKENE